MTTKWAHLPNAVHIDRVLASLKANPDKWVAAREAAGNAAGRAAYDAAWNAAWNAARDAVRNAAWDAARDAAWDAARDAVKKAARKAAYGPVRKAAWDAIAALVAYDDCAYMLESEPGELAILAKFGDPKAILLLPACKVFNKEKELV